MSAIFLGNLNYWQSDPVLINIGCKHFIDFLLSSTTVSVLSRATVPFKQLSFY